MKIIQHIEIICFNQYGLEGFIYFEEGTPIIRSEWINIIAEPPLSNSSGVSGNDWVKVPCMYAPMTRCQWSLSRNGTPTLAIHPSKTRWRVRYSTYFLSSFSLGTQKVSPGKSEPNFLEKMVVPFSLFYNNFPDC